jgi:methylenetetrahydrofolate reductase (NADPH)
VILLDGPEPEVIGHVPPGLTVTVTSSPTRRIDATLAVCKRLAAHGCCVVPHLAARLVLDSAHLRELLARLDERGVREVFVVAGDIRLHAGEFDGAPSLLAAMAEAGHRLEEIGITGYPESHAFISDEPTIQAMFDKAPLATYIVSQICFSPKVIGTWTRRVRDRGVELPISLQPRSRYVPHRSGPRFSDTFARQPPWRPTAGALTGGLPPSGETSSGRRRIAPVSNEASTT